MQKQKKNILEENIKLKGIRVNNLKNISLEIPRGKLIVVTGLSGSGKSSLAFDTLYAEGQRRYVESLSAYARQFLGRMLKPDCDYIKGIPPAIAIQQHVTTRSSRSTVGTSTEIYEYLRLLFARVGHTFSPVSGKEVKHEGVHDVVEKATSLPDGTKCYLLVNLPTGKDRGLKEILEVFQQQGYTRLVKGGEIIRIDDCLKIKYKKDLPKADELKLLIDRFKADSEDTELKTRVADSAEEAFFEGRGACILRIEDSSGNITEQNFSERFEEDGITFKDPTPQLFSFNNALGACPKCEGFGRVLGIDEHLVIPDPTLSVFEGCVACWIGPKSSEWQRAFINNSAAYDFPCHRAYYELTQEERNLLWHGVKMGDTYVVEGIDQYFEMLRREQHKIQNRVRLAHFRGVSTCPECHGTRLTKEALCVKVGGKNIAELCSLSISELHRFFIDLKLSEQEEFIAKRLLSEIRQRVKYLMEVGLTYLTLDRGMSTISGGESQRISLATQLGSSLVGSLYVLDEPSIGLHQRDAQRLIGVLKDLRDAGNTVVVVEHDEEVIRSADYIIDIGPEAGRHGGEIVYMGAPDQVTEKTPGHTAAFLCGKEKIALPKQLRPVNRKIHVEGAFIHNLKNISMDFPLNCLTVVSGVSGSGKSTLVREIFYKGVKQLLDGDALSKDGCKNISGDLELIEKVEYIDQNSIGTSTRSNPVTYVGAYNFIRELFASQTLSKQLGYMPYYFSFNKEGGRCEVCKGEGIITVEMQFMADLQLTCEECHGKRFKKEILEVEYKGKNIFDVLEMTVNEAIEFFSEDDSTLCKKIVEKLQCLQRVGLGYIKLGQNSSSLSGGENQRVKLASYLDLNNASPTLFIFDEPTTGLHLADVKTLLNAFNALIDKGHSIVVVEHNIEVIKSADYLIDLGPEGGNGGGQLVAVGRPRDVAACEESITGKYLRRFFN